MDIKDSDPIVIRAVALALLRQAQELLQALPESGATLHLQRAIDAIRTP